MKTAEFRILKRLDAAYRYHRGHALGEDLYTGERGNVRARLAWIDTQAPFALLAHDGGSDPRFIYVNATACNVFEYEKTEMIGMPSRLSADTDAREGRSNDLRKVHEDGFISGYSGTRIVTRRNICQENVVFLSGLFHQFWINSSVDRDLSGAFPPTI